MENNNKHTYAVKDVLMFINRDLGNISIPASILAVLQPDQIMAIKQMVIDPIESARQNLMLCVDAIQRADDEAAAAAEQAQQEQAENVLDQKETVAEEEEDSTLRSE